MPFRHLYLVPVFAAAVCRADSPVVLDPFVVRDELDQARQDIVPSLGATSYRLSADQISIQPLGENTSFNQVLLRTPSVAEDSFGQVHLRGEHGNLQYRIDDVLLPEGIAGFGQELDVPFVSSLSVITGTLPAQYGYRTAGVVDIHTQTGASRSEASVFGGSFDTLRTHVDAAGSGAALSGFFSVSAETTGLGVENPAPTRGALHDRSDQLKLFADSSWVIDPGNRMTLLVGSSEQRFQIPNSPGQQPTYAYGATTAFDSAGLNESQLEANDYAILAYQYTGSQVTAQASAFTRYSLTHFTPDVIGDLMFNGVASDVRQELVSNGFEFDAKWTAAPAHNVRFGGIVISSNAGTSTESGVFPVDSNGDQASITPVFISDNQRKLGWLYGVYAQDEWTPWSGGTINFGLRADASREALDEGQISPRVTVVEELAAGTSLHAGYAKYFTPPPLELTETPNLAAFANTSNAPEVEQNSPVRSERADYFDAGLSHRLTSDLTLSLDAYYKQATSQLDEGQFGAALINAAFNYARGRIYGGELSANYSHGGFAAYVNAAVGRAFGTAITSGEFEFGRSELDYIGSHWVHLDHDQALTASAGLSYQWSGNVVSLDSVYGSGLRSGFANTGHAAEYHPVNAAISHVFTLKGGHQLTARIDVTNVGDEIYQLRNGSGIGVFAPQYGQRRGYYGDIKYAF